MEQLGHLSNLRELAVHDIGIHNAQYMLGVLQASYTRGTLDV